MLFLSVHTPMRGEYLLFHPHAKFLAVVLSLCIFDHGMLIISHAMHYKNIYQVNHSCTVSYILSNFYRNSTDRHKIEY